MSDSWGKEKEGILEAPFYLSDSPKWWYTHKDWRQYCVCRLSIAPFTTTIPKGPSTAQQSLLSCFIDWTVEGQDHLQRSYQMFFSSINILMYLFCFGSLFFFFFCLAVLTLYFLYYLNWSEDSSASVYHAFSSLCYFTPILGAAIADSWLGKFK